LTIKNPQERFSTCVCLMAGEAGKIMEGTVKHLTTLYGANV
jgi:hypothetical protein